MRLYKPTKKGRPSTKDDPWWIELRDLHRRVRRFAAFADKEESRTFGKNIEKLISCKASGNPPGPESSAWVKDQPARLRDRFAALGLISTRQASAAKSLEDLLAEFEPTLLQGRGSRKQAALVMSRLRRIVAGCNAKRWEDLSRKAVAAFIEQQHQSGELSKRTCNFYIKHVRRFGRWLRRELALEASPFEDLQCKRFNKREDQVHERRALTAKQAKTLLQVAKNGPAILGMTGYQRYLAYKLAIETGLRRRELRALTPECFEFTARTVTVLGDRTKNKADAVLPLRAGTAAELREYCRHFTERATLFPIHDKSSKVMEADCLAAGLDYVDHAGRYADFHALRHTCGTLLAAAGVHPKNAQQIMRHSDIRLTMDYYTHFMTGQEHRAVESLPDLSGPADEESSTEAAG